MRGMFDLGQYLTKYGEVADLQRLMAMLCFLGGCKVPGA